MPDTVEQALQTIKCGCCEGWAVSAVETLKFLKGERQPCMHCPEKTTIELVTRQFQANCPKWWVVEGRAVVPVWIKEQVHRGRMRFR